MKDTYVTAVLELLNAGHKPDTVFSNLKNVMKSRGHSGLLPAVLKATLTAYEVAEKNATPTVIVADAKSADTKEVSAALIVLGANTPPLVVIDDTIIGGAQVVFNHKFIDQSYKTQLHTLYKAALDA